MTAAATEPSRERAELDAAQRKGRQALEAAQRIGDRARATLAPLRRKVATERTRAKALIGRAHWRAPMRLTYTEARALLRAWWTAFTPCMRVLDSQRGPSGSPNHPHDRRGDSDHQSDTAPTHPRAITRTLIAAPGAPSPHAVAAA